MHGIYVASFFQDNEHGINAKHRKGDRYDTYDIQCHDICGIIGGDGKGI